MSTSRLLALISGGGYGGGGGGGGGGGCGGDELMALISGLEELNMHLTMGTGGNIRLGEVCPALVALLGGPAAAASAEIVRERVMSVSLSPLLACPSSSSPPPPPPLKTNNNRPSKPRAR